MPTTNNSKKRKMKTKLITLLIAITAIVGSANAQKTVKVYKNGEVVYSEYITDIDSIKFEEQTAPLPNTENGHEYVDLGLPSGIKWATCNVGATTPEGYGDYFAWGETSPKTTYYVSTYKYCNGDLYSMTKYCVDSEYGTVDNKTTLELSDDAARVNWGGKWRMPTVNEQDELRFQCDWTWTTQNGVNGYKVTSKKNGNSIFLPAAGYRTSGNLSDAGSEGYYWSSSLNWEISNTAIDLFLYSSTTKFINFNRYYGLSVRAVCDSSTPAPTPIVYTVSVSATEGGTAEASATEVEEGTSVILTATPAQGYEFVNWTVNGKEVSTSATYTATITADTEFKANFKEFIPEYVDLGLPSGIKWATCNVGATTPEGYGDYFAWGETEPKTTYSWSTYKYHDSDKFSMTKYCTVDNKTVLELEDDAARVNWGGNWRMPTRAEQEELINTSNCTWTWTTQNGVNGYKVTSVKNGNSIFLPAAGYRDSEVHYNANSDGLYDAGSLGKYWSSSLYSSNSANDAYYLYSDWGYMDCSMYYIRYYGLSVRAVCQ